MFRNNSFRRPQVTTGRGRRAFRRGGVRNSAPRRKLAQRKRKNLTTFQSFAKSVIEFVHILPFVPAPVKSIADVVAHQLGIASSTQETDSHRAVAGYPNCIVAYFEVSILAFVSGSSQLVLNSPLGQYVTNYRTAQPKTWTITVSPVGVTQSREGYLHVAMFPYTSDKSPKEYRNFDKTGLAISSFVSRAPIKRRASALSTISLSYQVPRDNAYLNKGFELAKPSSENGIMAVYIGFELINRDSYDDFRTSDYNIAIKFNGQAKLGNQNTTEPIAVTGDLCYDLLTSLPPRSFIHVDKDGKKTFLDGTGFSYSDVDNAMYGPRQALSTDVTEEFEIVPKLGCLNM